MNSRGVTASQEASAQARNFSVVAEARKRFARLSRKAKAIEGSQELFEIALKVSRG